MNFSASIRESPKKTGSSVFGSGALPTARQMRKLRSNGPETFSHFGETGLAILAVEKGDERKHDRTPLFISLSMLRGHGFQPSSPDGKNGFFADLIGFSGK